MQNARNNLRDQLYRLADFKLHIEALFLKETYAEATASTAICVTVFKF